MDNNFPVVILTGDRKHLMVVAGSAVGHVLSPFVVKKSREGLCLK